MNNYRASLALGGSDARLIAKDFEAWMFKRRLIEAGELPPWMRDEPSEAQSFGTAVHMAILEPARFEREAVIMPYVESFVRKEGKDVKERAQAEAKERGGFVLRHEHNWAIDHIRASFRKAIEHDPSQVGEVEKTVFGTLDGVACKGMVDWLLDGIVYDVKTTRDITRTGYTYADERYGVQLAHYARLAGAHRAAIIWVENQAPFRVQIQMLDAEDFGRQITAHRMAMETYLRWKEV